MAEKKKKFIDDKKMTDFIEKNWAEYQKAQKAQKKSASGKKATSTPAKKRVKRK